MMYKIMILSAEKENYGSLYKFYTEKNEYGVQVPYEASTVEELNDKIEEMLSGTFKKKDLLIVTVTDFTISSNVNGSNSSENEDTVPSEPDTDETV